MDKPVQVGVIGLGRRWQKHYQPALRALRRQYRVRAVCDPIHRRALRVAADLGCAAAPGPTAMLEDSDVEALLLVDEPWYGLWPLGLACGANKPVFCAFPLEADEAHADAMQQLVQESGLPVLMALSPRLAPATAQLREVLEQRLGPARLVVCERTVPEHSRCQAAGLLGDVNTPLLDWCACIFGTAPQSVVAAGTAAGTFAHVLLEFADGRVAVVQSRRTHRQRSAVHLRAEAERGSAVVTLPRKVAWTDAEGRCTRTLPSAQPTARLQLERFHALVRAGRTAGPSFEDAYRLLEWLRAAAISRAEGRRVQLR
jgi:myo-inositol 2-dehydrogenase/D-chiro-inositol 1-dehydrogenase